MNILKKLFKSLDHDKILIRLVSLFYSGLILFFLSWILGYYFLPEGLLQNIRIINYITRDPSLLESAQEYIYYAVFYIGVFGFILLGNFIMKVRYFSYGYLIPLAWMVLYGLTVGTNSFLVPMDEVMAPSLAIFIQPGLYEILAASIMAVATYDLNIYYAESLTASSKRVQEGNRPELNKIHQRGIITAVLVLLIVNLVAVFM
ncbi:MAG: hypothetical protein ACQEQP_01035 [Bacillota bacterium]